MIMYVPISEMVKHEIASKYPAAELIEMMDIHVLDVIALFEDEILDNQAMFDLNDNTWKEEDYDN